MRQRLSDSIWTGPGRRPAGKLGLAAITATGLLLAGCVFEVPGPNLDGISQETSYGFPADETGAWTEHGATAREKAIAASDFSMEVVKFTDARRARSLEAETPDQLITQYDPEELLQGLNYRVPNILERYLAYKPRLPKNYKLEIELTRLLTLVKTGTTWSGSWGRYSVDMQLRVIARRDDSTVVMQRTYTLHDEQARDSNLGRGPSKERDRARMYDLTESMLRKICEQIGWDLRQRDARVWKIDRKAPAYDTRFGLDQGNGGMNDRNAVPEDGSNDQGVQWIDTTMPAVIVPARPAGEAPAPQDDLMPDLPQAPDAAPVQDGGNQASNEDEEGGNDSGDTLPGDLPTPAVPLGSDMMGPRG